MTVIDAGGPLWHGPVSLSKLDLSCPCQCAQLPKTRPVGREIGRRRWSHARERAPMRRSLGSCCVSRYPVASPGRGTALHPSAPSLLFFLLFFLSFYCRCCDFSIKRKRRWSDWHKSKVKRGKGDSVESLRGFVCTIKVPRTSYLSWKTVDKV